MRNDVTRPTVAEIDLNALRRNVDGIRRHIGPAVRIMAVVKANAYGHGSSLVSRALERHGVNAFGVAFAEEGAALRDQSITLPIHVFTLPAASQIPLYFSHALEPTISSEREIRLLQSAAERKRRSIGIHVKVDTGMNRVGVRVSDLPQIIRRIGRSRRLELKGVFTHFASADERDKRFTLWQFGQFERALEIFHENGATPPEIHCANSAAILDLPQTYCTMVRPGIMMYGYYPSSTTTESITIQPVMTLKSRIALVKTIEKGESVSYGRRYISRRRTQIATVPLGYADGFTRLLTGKASVLISGKKFPIAGTICMDQLMVDVGTEEVHVGDEVVLMGKQGRLSVTAADVARMIGTIPYEVCCAVSARVPRTRRGL